MSVLRLTALSVYATVFVWSVWAHGLPLERPVVIAWLLGLAIISLGGRQPGLACRAVADWIPFVLVMAAYDLSRGAADGLGMPLQIRLPIRVDEALFGAVPTVWLQQHLGPFGRDVHWWEVGPSLVYASHFIVPLALGVWLWARDRPRWQWWRNRFLTITVAGLMTYLLIPTAPPWYASRLGEIGTVHRTASRGWSLLGIHVADRVFDLGRAVVNPVAALPSLHAAFAAFVSVTLWRQTPRRWRPVLVAYPLAMGFALVISGEHYVFDVLLGWAYVVGTILLWRRLDRRLAPWRAGRAAQRAERAAAENSAAAETVVPTAPPVEPPDRRLPSRVWTVAALATLVALATRAFRIGKPDVLVFDEGFYALQAFEIAQTGVEQGHTVHPPAAKWAIAAGIRLLGFNPLGWRLVPLLAGALVVGFTVIAAFRATASLRLAAVAALVVLTDGIAIITGRLALLDGIVALWTTAAFAVLIGIAARPLDGVVLRRSAWPLGVLFGLAIASKWSAAPVWLASVGFVAWLAGQAHLPRRRPLLVLCLVPLGVYALSFAPTLINYSDSAVARVACADGATCDDGPFDRVVAIAHDHVEVLRYHTSLEPRNSYAVSSWSWIVQARPAVLYSLDGRTVSTRGNPLIWIAGTAALVFLGWIGACRRQPVPALIALWALCWWAPWAIGRRPGYSFYAAPLVPVLAVGIAVALARLPHRWRQVGIGATVVTALVGAALLAPVWFAL